MVEGLSVKHRALAWVINRIVGLTNKRVDVAALQKAHGAVEGRVTRLRITDLDVNYHFVVKDGKLDFVVKPGVVAGEIETTSDTILCIATGKREVMNPATRARFMKEYTPIDAINYGDLKIRGEAVTNDALLFARAIYTEVAPRLRADLQLPEKQAEN